jgi:hypothetical protein
MKNKNNNNLNISAEDEKTVREIFIQGIRKNGFPIASSHDAGEGIFTVIYVDKNERITRYGEVTACEEEPITGLDNLDTVSLGDLALQGVHKKDELAWDTMMELIKEAKERMIE